MRDKPTSFSGRSKLTKKGSKVSVLWNQLRWFLFVDLGHNRNSIVGENCEIWNHPTAWLSIKKSVFVLEVQFSFVYPRQVNFGHKTFYANAERVHGGSDKPCLIFKLRSAKHFDDLSCDWNDKQLHSLFVGVKKEMRAEVVLKLNFISCPRDGHSHYTAFSLQNCLIETAWRTTGNTLRRKVS